jgi:hypothetical protein
MHKKTLLLGLLAGFALSGAALAQSGVYEERSTTSSNPTNIRVFEPHANASTRYTSSRTGDGGGTEEQITFASDPAPYVFGRAEAWHMGGVAPKSHFDASLLYGFTISGPANGLVPVRFEGRYEISNDSFLTQTYADFAMSVSGMDFSRPDQVGMAARCAGGGYNGAHCDVDTAGWPSVNGSIQVTQRLLGFEPVLWGAAVDGTFAGVLMAPTDASGLARGLINLHVSGLAFGVRSEGLSGVSWAFIDPALSIDSDYLAAFPDAQLLLTPGVGNQMVPSPVPEPSTWALLLAGLGLISVAARRRRG